jgi:Spy/CpxP family protein refolding chaperone
VASAATNYCRRIRFISIQSSEGAIMRFLLMSLVCAVALLAAPAYAQNTSADMNMQILRDKVKADKKVLVAANMQLTDAEAKAFWPIYDQYQNDLKAINERLGKAILAYADAYNAGPVPDPTAKKLLDESIAIDTAEVNLRTDYAARLTAAIPAAKAARYLQIENKIRAMVRYELAAGIPLVQ